MLHRLLSPRMVVMHLVVVAIAVLFVSLGLWQLGRRGEVAVENARIERQLAQAPVAVEEALADDDPDLLPVTATGEFDAANEVQLGPRSRNERPGYDVLTPLTLQDGRVLLVDRGWVPLDSDAPSPPQEETSVMGRLRSPATARQVLREEGRITLVSNPDLEVLAEQVPGLVTTAYLERVDGEQGSIPRPAGPVELDAGPHLSYAIQWFSFAAIGLVGYPLLLRRRLSEQVASSTP